MSSTAYVERAAGWANDLVTRESRGPGDYDNAMRRVGRALGVRYSALWGLRYRRPKSVGAEIYEPLRLAWEGLDQTFSGDVLVREFAELHSRLARLEGQPAAPDVVRAVAEGGAVRCHSG